MKISNIEINEKMSKALDALVELRNSMPHRSTVAVKAAVDLVLQDYVNDEFEILKDFSIEDRKRLKELLKGIT